jgi:uncharacterized membrane protein YeaQ/YmgE (transglycosylase-associated protein family)
MSMLVWMLLGFVVGVIASKIINNSGEGTVVDAFIGIVGAVVGGWLFNLFGGTGITGVNIDSAYSAGVGIVCAVIFLAIYHSLFRRRML